MTADFETSWDEPRPSYRPARTPDGTRQVMLYDNAPWPDRFDTDRWPVRAVSARTTWMRCGDWAWRGGGVAAEVGDFERTALAGTVTYLLGLPHRRNLAWLRHDFPAELVDTRDDVLNALAGRPTTGDLIIDQLRYHAWSELLPECPAPGCTGKASVTLRAKIGGCSPLWRQLPGGWASGALRAWETVDCCPEHASEERKRFDGRGWPLWDVIPTPR
jgi:hypothetical protein